MTQDEIKQKFTSILEKRDIDVSSINDNSKMVEDLKIDSLDFVEIVMDLEEELKVSIPESEIENLKTFGEIVAYIEKQLN
ncbi:acyl carrier protein [Rickettsiales bacterium LUAb2]